MLLSCNNQNHPPIYIVKFGFVDMVYPGSIKDGYQNEKVMDSFDDEENHDCTVQVRLRNSIKHGLHTAYAPSCVR